MVTAYTEILTIFFLGHAISFQNIITRQVGLGRPPLRERPFYLKSKNLFLRHLFANNFILPPYCKDYFCQTGPKRLVWYYFLLFIMHDFCSFFFFFFFFGGGGGGGRETGGVIAQSQSLLTNKMVCLE